MRTRLKFALALALWVMPTPVSIEVKSVTIIFTAPLSCPSLREGQRDFDRTLAGARHHTALDGDLR